MKDAFHGSGGTGINFLLVDPQAFIVQQSVDDTTGGLLKRKKLH